MADKYSFITIKKISSMGTLSAAYAHNYRTSYVPNADSELRMRNEELVNRTSFNYNELWERRMKAAKAKVGRKDAVRAYEIITTYSDTGYVDVEEWKKDNVRWMQEYFGKDNVLSMMFHGDECGNVHIHSIVIPIDERGRLCAKSFTGGAKKMHELQNSYGHAMEKHGLKRGLENTRAKHQDIRRFYASLNNAATEQVPEREPNEDFETYFERVNTYLQEKELRHLGEKQALKREVDEAKTHLFTFRKKYKKAIKLYDTWEGLYGLESTEAQFDKLLAKTEENRQAAKEKELSD